jgi:hypothetical protein
MWQRCRGSVYYRKTYPESPLKMAFVNPILITMVSTHPRKRGLFGKEVEVISNEFVRVIPEFIRKTLKPNDATTLETWANYILEHTQGKPRKTADLQYWAPMVLENLDVDLVERDRLLDAIEEYITHFSRRTGETMMWDSLTVPYNENAVADGLGAYGIPQMLCE